MFRLYGAFDVHQVGFLFLFLSVRIEFVEFQFDESQSLVFGLVLLMLLFGVAVSHLIDLF